MPRVGVVLETRDGLAVVSTARRGGCAECHDRDHCPELTPFNDGTPEKVTVQNPIGAKPGEFVEFDLVGRIELKLSLLVWALPLLGLVAGVIAGGYFHDLVGISPDSGSAIGGILGLIATFTPVVLYDRLSARNRDLVPVILRVTQDACALPAASGEASASKEQT